MVDHSGMALGKKAAIFHPNTLKFSAYYQKSSTIPDAQDWYSKVPYWPMMRNDTVGCCSIAGIGHAIQQWTTYAQYPLILTDDQVIVAYSGLTGYDPNNPSHDPGAHEIDALNYWRRFGIDTGRQAKDVLTAYTSINHSDINELKKSIFLFGNAYIGLLLPKTCLTQDVWDLVSTHGDGAPGSYGGHAVLVTGYDLEGVFLVSWGILKKATWAFIQAYMDEAYALVSRDWLDTTGTSPNHFSFDILMEDLKSI